MGETPIIGVQHTLFPSSPPPPSFLCISHDNIHEINT